MSIVATTKQLLLKYLPPAALKPLQQLAARLPVRLPQGPPICVMYVNDSEIRSYVGLNNFYSFLLATDVTDADAELQFFAPNGNRILTHRVPIEHFGARMVDVAAIFAKHDVSSPHGIVAVQITPHQPRRVALREIGIAYSQFFIFFEGKRSVGLVHPLSNVGPHNHPGDAFESSQLVATDGLVALEALQYNPGTVARRIEMRLLDSATREVLARQVATISGLGTHRALFRMASLPRLPAQLLFSIDRLPSGNSKPMLRRIYDDVFTISHA